MESIKAESPTVSGIYFIKDYLEAAHKCGLIYIKEYGNETRKA